ncbi:MAG: M56 family metallopeptidase [Eubacteriales bacterium]
MAGEIFYWFFNMSIAASLSGVIVLLIGHIRKLPRRFACVLFVIPFIRMWIPVGLGSKYGLLSLISRFTTRSVAFFDSSFTTTNYIMAANSYFPITYKANVLENVFKISFYVWAVTAAALLAALFILYGATMKQLKNAKHLKDDVYISEYIDSPALYGIIKPRIILPASYEEKELDFVLLHERMHKKRGDNLWRMLAFITATVHWFNPLAWVLLRGYLSAAELACDEAVLAKCGEERKKAYALALVSCEEKKTFFASAFGGAKIRVRIENILSYKKLSALSAVGFTALVLVIMYTLLTNAK